MGVNYRKVSGYHAGEEYRGMGDAEIDWLTEFDQDYYAQFDPRDLMGLCMARSEVASDTYGHCSEVVAWWVSQKKRRRSMRQSHSYTLSDYRALLESPEDALILWIDNAVSV
jgi:hypothetical protein